VSGLLEDVAMPVSTAAEFSAVHAAPRARRIVHRTYGRRRGPVIRLVSPSDLGRLLKPFVFLDLLDADGASLSGFGMHPHSGVATLTWIMQGSVSYEDTTGKTGLLSQGGVEWMHAGGGAWHGGGPGEPGRVRGFRLWVALPPACESEPAQSIYLAPDLVAQEGPARVLIGAYGAARSEIQAPSPMTYLSVRLKAGERWRFRPPEGHTVGWVALGAGALRAPEVLSAGELGIFDEANDAIDFEAEVDVEFVLGSAVKHPHDLVIGHYSVHTSAAALHEGEARIRRIGLRLRNEGCLDD
jgi:redox-sensitive bicupin YhaK (pirin superfamily)